MFSWWVGARALLAFAILLGRRSGSIEVPKDEEDQGAQKTSLCEWWRLRRPVYLRQQ
jgi:hypothetical protein